MKKFIKLFSVFAIIFQFAIMANFALAACTCSLPASNISYKDCVSACANLSDTGCKQDEDCMIATGGTCTPGVGGTNTCPTDSSGQSVNLANPISAKSIPELIGNVINVALGVVGSLALIMFIYGGFTWMLAAGNENAVEKGKNILVWATIGLVVIFASYSLVNFIINTGIRGGTPTP